MLIYYFQIKKLIAITLGEIILSLHSFNIHIKCVAYKCNSEVGFWQSVFESMLVTYSCVSSTSLMFGKTCEETLKLPNKYILIA